MNPIETLLSWLANLSGDIREDLVAHVDMITPSGLLSTGGGGTFVDAIRSVQGERDDLRALGFCICACALIDHVIGNKADPSGWSRAEEAHKRAIERGGKGAEHHRAMLAELPTLQAKWAPVADSWRAKRATELSAGAMEAWIDKTNEIDAWRLISRNVGKA